jgi:tetratricopeptide (TPR) repeat protein
MIQSTLTSKFQQEIVDEAKALMDGGATIFTDGAEGSGEAEVLTRYAPVFERMGFEPNESLDLVRLLMRDDLPGMAERPALSRISEEFVSRLNTYALIAKHGPDAHAQHFHDVVVTISSDTRNAALQESNQLRIELGAATPSASPNPSVALAQQVAIDASFAEEHARAAESFYQHSFDLENPFPETTTAQELNAWVDKQWVIDELLLYRLHKGISQGAFDGGTYLRLGKVYLSLGKADTAMRYFAEGLARLKSPAEREAYLDGMREYLEAHKDDLEREKMIPYIFFATIPLMALAFCLLKSSYATAAAQNGIARGESSGHTELQLNERQSALIKSFDDDLIEIVNKAGEPEARLGEDYLQRLRQDKSQQKQLEKNIASYLKASPNSLQRWLRGFAFFRAPDAPLGRYVQELATSYDQYTQPDPSEAGSSGGNQFSQFRSSIAVLQFSAGRDVPTVNDLNNRFADALALYTVSKLVGEMQTA